MDVIFYIFILIATYFFLVFVLLRLVAPFMGFGEYKPAFQDFLEIKTAVENLKRQSFDQMTFLENLYKFILNKNQKQWGHTRGMAAVMPHRLFVKNLEAIWTTEKFVYCNAINYVAYAMLLMSKFFKPEDIRSCHVFLNFVPHQYLQVKVYGKWIDFDPAGSGIRGGVLGTHASFFG